MNVNVAMSEISQETVRTLMARTGKSMTEILDEAVEDYRRKVFLDAVNAGYAAMRADPQAWADELEERKLWEATLMDGVDPDEGWTEDGRADPRETDGR